MSELYPPIEPFNYGHLKVSEIHSIYYEQCGNENGLPVVFLHGGPGAGINERDRRYFDPKSYHVILLDQRGAGKSTPAFSLDENDTWYLVGDIEKLRNHLGIPRWLVFGGSWGSTLSLAYAETHIDRVLGLILWGIFTFREDEVRWLYQKGASYIFPDYWEKYIEEIPSEERDDLLQAYHKRLTGDNEDQKKRCAKAWSEWEMATSQLKVNFDNLKKCETDPNWTLAMARIECHYMINKGFLKSNSQFLDDAHIIKDNGIPVTIIQGRYDMVCPCRTAWDLYKRLGDNATFCWVDDAGHSDEEVGTTREIVKALDKFISK